VESAELYLKSETMSYLWPYCSWLWNEESKLKDFAETSDNPFDQGKNIAGLENKKRLTPAQKKNKKLKVRMQREKDEDIKQELKKGNIVEVIENGSDYCD